MSESQSRRLAAILAADIAGYSALMGADEARTVRDLKGLQVAVMAEVEAAARSLGIEVAKVEIRRTEDIAPAFETLQRQADALYVVVDGLVSTNRTRIFTLATSARLPTIVNTREHAEAGALMSFGPSFHALFRRAAEYVDKILRGAKPADIPVEQPTNYDLVINLITAKAIGLAISPTLLARANDVIE
jgi:putative ABC transport system substrate-binding protein